MKQSIESKNKNILARNDKELSSGNMTAFRVMVDGDSMTFLSKTCKTKKEARDSLLKKHPLAQEIIFLE